MCMNNIAMFVYFDRLLFKSISLPPLLPFLSASSIPFLSTPPFLPTSQFICIPPSLPPLLSLLPVQPLFSFLFLRHVNREKKKKSENCGSPTEARPASRVTQLGVWGPPKFFDIFNCSKEFWGIW